MDKAALDIQKRFVKTFLELEKELEINSSKTNATGWQQRNELISHVYSGYNNHEALNSKRKEHQKHIQRGNVMQWLYKKLQENRDLYGYFENPEEFIKTLNNLIEESVTKELYEIAEELNKWRKKLIA
ncbi:hypothetical protein [Tenacibaculum maritimum]|uniref:Uncharacterized protein n=1 Tax=Tenacibaculum maritimum NCIMB 2154 TaxID=1349785 RepID=A0A2H1EC36_9FLAO|nr:hypothetical protein [Tenacibaculum maritimum]SFZ83999.1 protein of unknown function [Tenacibaculum maritimum NCIMB 2154]